MNNIGKLENKSSFYEGKYSNLFDHHTKNINKLLISTTETTAPFEYNLESTSKRICPQKNKNINSNKMNIEEKLNAMTGMHTKIMEMMESPTSNYRKQNETKILSHTFSDSFNPQKYLTSMNQTANLQSAFQRQNQQNKNLHRRKFQIVNNMDNFKEKIDRGQDQLSNQFSSPRNELFSNGTRFIPQVLSLEEISNKESYPNLGYNDTKSKKVELQNLMLKLQSPKQKEYMSARKQTSEGSIGKILKNDPIYRPQQLVQEDFNFNINGFSGRKVAHGQQEKQINQFDLKTPHKQTFRYTPPPPYQQSPPNIYMKTPPMCRLSLPNVPKHSQASANSNKLNNTFSQPFTRPSSSSKQRKIMLSTATLMQNPNFIKNKSLQKPFKRRKSSAGINVTLLNK